jgi:serine/threonine protein kinase
MSTKKNKKMIGGIPVYPGGYSCVFKPQLKCKTETKRTRTRTRTRRKDANNGKKNNNGRYDKGISKLLFKNYADIEMRNIENFYNALKKIPKSHKYFLFTKTKTCPPAKISKHDLRGFDEMCANFTSRDVNESNINSPAVIRSLKLINMPDAGISVNEWLFYKEKDAVSPLNLTRIKIFNKVISKLIGNAIAPMNRQGVIHNDMKEDNILIKDADADADADTTLHASDKKKSSKIIPASTIIDWGISGISTRHEPIPEIIMNRHISISNPFSSILFTTEFSKNYSDFLKQNGIIDNVDVRSMRNDFAFQQKLRDFSLSQYLKHKETGHYSNIQRFFTNAFNLFPEFFSPSSSSNSLQNQEIKTPDELYHALASSYISDVLFHFTEIDKRDGIARFQYVAYFTKVYIFNCDIWGTAFCYSIFFSFRDKYKYDEYIGVDPRAYSQFLRSILSIYMNQIMINGHEKINVSKLIKSIQKSL